MAFEIPLYQADDLAFIGVAPGLFLRVHQRTVNRDFKPAAVCRNQGDGFGLGLEMLQQFGRQTGSLVGVVSDRAIFDRRFQQHVGSSGEF
jgi:hypothetical protein